MRKIAAQYTDKHEKTLYESAADRFRLPFWDPVIPRNPVNKDVPLYDRVYSGVWGLPKILTTEVIWVKKPHGKQMEEMANPLYRFNFPKEETISKKGRKPITFPEQIVSFSLLQAGTMRSYT